MLKQKITILSFLCFFIVVSTIPAQGQSTTERNWNKFKGEIGELTKTLAGSSRNLCYGMEKNFIFAQKKLPHIGQKIQKAYEEKDFQAIQVIQFWCRNIILSDDFEDFASEWEDFWKDDNYNCHLHGNHFEKGLIMVRDLMEKHKRRKAVEDIDYMITLARDSNLK